MIHLMPESTDRDALNDEIDAVLRENRFVLERTKDTGERLLRSFYAYRDSVHALLREAGIELPGRRRAYGRCRCRHCGRV
jgi:hypothetical protein